MLRTLEELIDKENPGWPVLKEWIDLASNKVDILPCSVEDAENALVHTQVATHSLIGAIVYETGGLLINDGLIRILGAGCDSLKRSLPAWNKGKTFQEYGELAPYLLIADDAVGGFYAINGGYLGNDAGNIYYFAPDLLSWEPMDIGYSQFLLFCFESDLDDFYSDIRWENWQNDIKQLNPDYAYSFFPFLSTKEAVNKQNVSRKVLPIEEVYKLNMEMKDIL